MKITPGIIRKPTRQSEREEEEDVSGSVETPAGDRKKDIVKPTNDETNQIVVSQSETVIST